MLSRMDYGDSDDLNRFQFAHGKASILLLDRLGYPVSDIEIGIGDDDVTIECVDVIISHIARLCGDLNTRDKLTVSRKYRTA